LVVGTAADGTISPTNARLDSGPKRWTVGIFVDLALALFGLTVFGAVIVSLRALLRAERRPAAGRAGGF
jgi:hypothetical protein